MTNEGFLFLFWAKFLPKCEPTDWFSVKTCINKLTSDQC